MRAVLAGENKLATIASHYELPQLKQDEILVKVNYAALNRADLLQRDGKYPSPPGVTPVLGLEASGVVMQLNLSEDAKTDLKIGDQVMILVSGGAFADYVACHYSHAMKIPEGLSLREAAAIPEAFLTAYQALYLIGDLNEKSSCLIHAAASGVGIAAIQIAKYKNKQVVATTTSAFKTAVCKELGADLTLVLPKSSAASDAESVSEWDIEILKSFPKGIDVLLDPVGQDYFEKNKAVVGVDGNWVFIALMSGSVLPNGVDLRPLLGKRVNLHFTTLRNRSIEYKTKLIREFVQFADGLSVFTSGKLKALVDKEFDFASINAAFQHMESNANIGKIVVKIN